MNKFLILIIFVSSFCFSQQDVVTSGGDGESNSGSFSYSIGQILVFEMKSSKDAWSEEALSLNHGVQQIYIPTCTNSEKIQIIASPNPSSGIVNMEFLKWDDIELNIQVFDVSGKFIFSRKINQSKTQLNLDGLSSGVYIISVNNVCGKSSTFKLILNTQ
ncbi:MAG: T9SS type A sorting domain-containing protein [Flavobacteriaceae bacterium]